MIQLIALDMDGTLLADDLTIPKKNAEAISAAKSRGIEVILCTGRSKTGAVPFADELKLQSHLISGNGSEIWLKSGELLERTPLQTPFVEEMLQIQKKTGTTFWAASTKDVYRQTIPENLYEHTWLKFGYDTPDDTLRQYIHDELQRFDHLEVTNSSLTNLEINAAGVNKANALQRLTEQLGIAMENVLAVGDSLNDVQMIKKSGVGVAMANAQDIVKETADWETLTNNEAGVAEAIEAYL